LVAEVAFAEWTREGILRQPVFLGTAHRQGREERRARADSEQILNA